VTTTGTPASAIGETLEPSDPADWGAVRRRFIFGLGWASTGRIAALVGSIGVNAVVARILVPEDVGAYFLIVAVTTILAITSLLGLNQAIVRMIPESLALRRPAEARRAAWVCIAVGAASSFVFGLVLLAVVKPLATDVFSSPPMAGAAVLVALLVPATAIRLLVPEVFRGLHDLRLASLFGDGATNLALAAALGVVFLAAGHTHLSVVLAASIGTAGALIAWSLLRVAVAARNLPRGGEVRVRGTLRMSLPMLAANLSWVFLAQIDLLILGAFRPNSEVAYYGAADRIATLLFFPLLVTNAVVAPLIAELWFDKRPAALQRLVRSTATFNALLCGAGLVVVIVAGGPILGLVFGDFYRQGAAVLVALAVGAFLNSAAGPCGLALVLTGQQVATMVVTVAVTVVTTVAVAWTASVYGALGVAVAMTIGVGVQNLAMLLLVKQRLGIWTLPSLAAVPAAIRSQ